MESQPSAYRTLKIILIACSICEIVFCAWGLIFAGYTRYIEETINFIYTYTYFFYPELGLKVGCCIDYLLMLFKPNFIYTRKRTQIIIVVLGIIANISLISRILYLRNEYKIIETKCWGLIGGCIPGIAFCSLLLFYIFKVSAEYESSMMGQGIGYQPPGYNAAYPGTGVPA